MTLAAPPVEPPSSREVNEEEAETVELHAEDVKCFLKKKEMMTSPELPSHHQMRRRKKRWQYNKINFYIYFGFCPALTRLKVSDGTELTCTAIKMVPLVACLCSPPSVIMIFYTHDRQGVSII